jgi:hypothetical protein
VAEINSPWRYLALFEIETDLRGALDTLVARSRTNLMPSSDTVDLQSVATSSTGPSRPG